MDAGQIWGRNSCANRMELCVLLLGLACCTTHRCSPLLPSPCTISVPISLPCSCPAAVRQSQAALSETGVQPRSIWAVCLHPCVTPLQRTWSSGSGSPLSHGYHINSPTAEGKHRWGSKSGSSPAIRAVLRERALDQDSSSVPG